MMCIDENGTRLWGQLEGEVRQQDCDTDIVHHVSQGLPNALPSKQKAAIFSLLSSFESDS